MPFEQIAAISGTAFLPHAWKIFWCPLIDLGPHRKVWYLVCSAITAALLAAAAMIPSGQRVGLLILLLTAAQAFAATSSAALDALIAICSRDEDKGRAGGFYMAGNVRGTGVLGAGAIWLGDHSSPQVAGSSRRRRGARLHRRGHAGRAEEGRRRRRPLVARALGPRAPTSPATCGPPCARARASPASSSSPRRWAAAP